MYRTPLTTLVVLTVRELLYGVRSVDPHFWHAVEY